MAAAADEGSCSWVVNKWSKVAVYNGIPQLTESDVVLKCFETDNPEDGVAKRVKASVMHIEFPVPKLSSQMPSRNILGETFRMVVQENVRSLRCRILISVDEVKTWTKDEFCGVILTEFLRYAKAEERMHLDSETTLTFCAQKIHNYEEAVKCCNKAFRTKDSVSSTGMAKKKTQLSLYKKHKKPTSTFKRKLVITESTKKKSSNRKSITVSTPRATPSKRYLKSHSGKRKETPVKSPFVALKLSEYEIG